MITLCILWFVLGPLLKKFGAKEYLHRLLGAWQDTAFARTSLTLPKLFGPAVLGLLLTLPAAFGQPTLQQRTVTSLQPEARPIDLASAFQLAGVQNPEIMLARERTLEAVALRQLAAAQYLPSLNAGTNIDMHTGALQQANGNILNVNRDSMYIGFGANAVAAGTVNIPGLAWRGNVSVTIYQELVSRQIVQQREFASQAVRNDTLLRVAAGYLDLLRFEGRHAIALKVQKDAAEVARVTANFARTGQGRQSDADRAATELELRNNDRLQAENDLFNASARLCRLLGLDPSVRLHPVDGWVVPNPLVPDPIPVADLLAIALTQRPELRERQAAIRAALLELTGAKVLPFSPNLILGLSSGATGGGSNLIANGIPQPNGNVLSGPRFSDLKNREDYDAVLFWTLQNLAVGNVAMIRAAQSKVRQTEHRNMDVLNRVRAEVVQAYTRTHVRYVQIEAHERGVQASQRAFTQDLIRTKNREGLPIEVMDSLRLLTRSSYAYLDTIIEYNRAHFDLYVALGQPPADLLARPVPGHGIQVPTTVAPERK